MLAVLAAGLFFASILAHEAAHAVMARGLDLPVRGVTLVFWGGATETRADLHGPLGEFLVAFVGPATTLALAGVFWVAHIATDGVVSEIVGYLSWLSLIFAGLNALPGVPARRGTDAARGRLGPHEEPPARVTRRGMVRDRCRAGVRCRRHLVAGERRRGTRHLHRLHRAHPRHDGPRHGPADRAPRSTLAGTRRRRDAAAAADHPRHVEPGGGARPRPARHHGPAVPGRRRERALHRHGLDAERPPAGRPRSAASRARRLDPVEPDDGRAIATRRSTTRSNGWAARTAWSWTTGSRSGRSVRATSRSGTAG